MADGQRSVPGPGSRRHDRCRLLGPSDVGERRSVFGNGLRVRPPHTRFVARAAWTCLFGTCLVDVPSKVSWSGHRSRWSTRVPLLVRFGVRVTRAAGHWFSGLICWVSRFRTPVFGVPRFPGFLQSPGEGSPDPCRSGGDRGADNPDSVVLGRIHRVGQGRAIRRGAAAVAAAVATGGGDGVVFVGPGRAPVARLRAPVPSAWTARGCGRPSPSPR